MWDDMRAELEPCSSTWWADLPNQGADRMWLKAIGNPSTEAENIMRCKVENMMKPFLDYVTKQNPYLTYWKVEALHPKQRVSTKNVIFNCTLITLKES
jgi:hypothetical protein